MKLGSVSTDSSTLSSCISMEPPAPLSASGRLGAPSSCASVASSGTEPLMWSSSAWVSTSLNPSPLKAS